MQSSFESGLVKLDKKHSAHAARLAMPARGVVDALRLGRLQSTIPNRGEREERWSLVTRYKLKCVSADRGRYYVSDFGLATPHGRCGLFANATRIARFSGLFRLAGRCYFNC